MHFNYARTFDDLKMYHLATKHYQRVLALADTHPHLHPSHGAASSTPGHGHLSLTREAAHNLVLIYKRSDAPDFALEVMLKYLRI